MLDWTKIDNDKTFQRLVNHLFAVECNSPGFIPSSPYIGADGGWDGYYSGEYPLEHEKGEWSIQAKCTKKSFKDAMRYLKRQVKKELLKAMKKQIEHLRIATNAELKVEQVLELESLKTNDVNTLRVWHRERLALRIEQQPFVRHLFFGSPQYPMLVPANIYFKECEPDLLSVPVTKIPKFEEYVHQVEQFILSKSKSILLVHSPGGYGKSHLLKGITEMAHDIDPQKQCWIVRAGHRKVEDAIQEEIVNGREYVLVFDDADRDLESVRPLLALTKFKSNSFKLILSARSSGFAYIWDMVTELKCEGMFEEMKISDWSKADLVELLRMATDLPTVENEDIIAAKYCNPFLIVWIGKRLKREPTLDITDIKRKFVATIRYDANRCLKGIIDPAMTDVLLTNLSCIVPFSKDDEIILNVLKEQAKADKLVEAIDALQRAGILRLVGNFLRFNPDMSGDFYLAYSLEDSADQRRLEQLTERWLPLSAGEFFINLEAALQYARGPHIETILCKILDSWVAEAETTPGHVRIDRLTLIKNIAWSVPKNCLNVLYAYLKSEAPPSDYGIPGLGLRDIQVTSDYYGPVLLKMQMIPEVRNELLGVIEQLETKNLVGMYDNYKTNSLVSHYLSPLYNTFQLMLTTLEILKQWVEHATDARIKLTSAGLTEILGAAHERTRYGSASVTYEKICVGVSQEIYQVRDRAVDILKNMLRHSSLKIKLAGVEVAEQIGRSKMGGIMEKDVPLASKMAQERKEIVRELSDLVSPKTDYPLLSAIEDVFLRWWALQTGGTDEVEGHLSKFPRDPEYLVFRYFVAPRDVVIDFDSLRTKAPEKDRWPWFVDQVFKDNRLFASQPESFHDLVVPLNDKFKTKEELIEYLERLEQQISPYNVSPQPPIITCWVKMNDRLFLSLLEDSSLWLRVPQRFQREIKIALSDLNDEVISTEAQSILSRLPNVPPWEVSDLLRMIERHSLSEATIDSWLSQLLDKGTSEIRAMVIHTLYFISQTTKNLLLAVKLWSMAVSKETILDKKVVFSLGFVIHNLRKPLEELDGESVGSLRRKLAEKVRDIPRIDWESEQIIDFALEDLSSFVDFIEYRLSMSRKFREKGTFEEDYDAIPHGGFECLSRRIKCFDDYEKLMQKVFTWSEEDSFAKHQDLEDLMSPVACLRDTNSDKLYLQTYIEKQLEEGRLRPAVALSEFLPLSQETIDLFLKVGEEAMTAGLVPETENLFYYKTNLEGPWSSTPGEPPPLLVERKNLFLKMYQAAKPGKLKMLFSRCIEAIDREINDHAKQDEEFLNPR